MKNLLHTTIYLCTILFLLFLPTSQVQASDMPTQIRTAATAHDIPPALLAAIIQNESDFNPNNISSDGCVGLGRLCKEESWRPTIEVQCEQNTSDGQQLCSRTCNTSNPDYTWCEVCTGPASTCDPDDRFNIEKNITETARNVASKIAGVVTAGCDLSTEAGIKAAIYAHELGAERLTPAIAAVSCDDYETLWQEARSNFTPTPPTCTADTDCAGGATCEPHSEFANDVCEGSDGPLGIVYTGAPISLSQLNSTGDDTNDTELSQIYTYYAEFGGDTPNSLFNQIGQSGSCSPINTGRNIKIGIPNPIIKIPGLSFNFDTEEELLRVNSDGSTTLIIPFLAEYIAAVYRYAVGLGGILLGLVILVSGIQIMLPGNIVTTGSGDSKQTTNKAKQRIISAITGLLLLYGSYTILYIINPNLVILKPLEVDYLPGRPIGPDPYLGNTLVDTSLFGTSDYSQMQSGEWSPTITFCPVNMGYSLDPAASSRERDAYNYELYQKLKATFANPPFSVLPIDKRVVAAAEAVSECHVVFGSCGTTAGTIHAIAGSGDKHSRCFTTDDNDCNGNRGEVIFHASGVNRAITYGQNCGTSPEDPVNSHITNNYSCIDPGIDGTYPRDDCTNDKKEARMRVLAFFQEQMRRGELDESTDYPADILEQLRPGDYVVYYNGNTSLTGSHAVIFLGWANEPGVAQVISGSAERAARPHTACLGAECGEDMMPITGAFRPGQ